MGKPSIVFRSGSTFTITFGAVWGVLMSCGKTQQSPLSWVIWTIPSYGRSSFMMFYGCLWHLDHYSHFFRKHEQKHKNWFQSMGAHPFFGHPFQQDVPWNPKESSGLSLLDTSVDRLQSSNARDMARNAGPSSWGPLRGSSGGQFQPNMSFPGRHIFWSILAIEKHSQKPIFLTPEAYGSQGSVSFSLKPATHLWHAAMAGMAGLVMFWVCSDLLQRLGTNSCVESIATATILDCISTSYSYSI